LGGRSRRLIEAKLRPPAIREDALQRPRVEAALEAAARRNAIVAVVATAGAGKTTAVAQFARRRPGPVAWLTLDESDRIAGRFVTYLAAALGEAEPELPTQAQEALADALSPQDCAAMLAEAIDPGWTVVIDDLHHLERGASALRALGAFLRYLTPGSLAILISRRWPGGELAREFVAGRAGALRAGELSFSLEETAALISARGTTADPAAVHRATGGWAAGVAFEGLGDEEVSRSALAAGGEDPLFSYLGAEILDTLPARLRGVVLRSGVLDLVTEDRLRRLLGTRNAAAIFDALCGLQLPAVRESDGLRYNPRFREFLLHRLGREAEAELAELRARFGRILVDEGFLEEGIDALIAASRPDEAEALAERAVEILMRRGDWDKVLDWTSALGDEALRRRHGLRGAQVRSLLMSRRQHEVEDLVQGMLASGEVAALSEEAPDVAAWAIWALHESGDWARLLSLLPDGGEWPRLAVMRHIFAVGTAVDPPPAFPIAAERLQPLLVPLQGTLLTQGRFDDIERLAGAAARRGPVTATVAQIHRIMVLRARGDRAAARRLLDATAPTVRASRYIEFWQAAEAELLFDEGERERGLELVREARRTSREHHYRIGDRAIFAIAEGRMLVRMGLMSEALEVLEEIRSWCAEREMLAGREWAETWLGAALLSLEPDPAPALALLRPAAEGMRRAGRWVELPAAGVFLAEAEWRAGDEEAHDAAADLAHAAAEACGTLAPLALALELAPQVLTRRLDASDDEDGRWHRLLRAGGSGTPPAPPADPVLRVRTFGAPGLEAGGERLRVNLTKAVELAAYLAKAGPTGASRSAVLGELFEDSREAEGYLRQVVHRLRRVLPQGLALTSVGGRLAWDPAGAVLADDQAFEATIGRARLEVGERRTASLAGALALVDAGAYMAGVDGRWTSLRRQRLADLACEARVDYVRSMLSIGSPREAFDAALAAVTENPYREDAWQQLMRAQAAVGGPQTALPVFLECQQALGRVGVEPSNATRRLLRALRG
jgi:ATP/maltotriose-dependent transcriptional regulator MalT/DNA-binding SARP family transcriptional activator